jgi:hypothetical protein
MIEDEEEQLNNYVEPIYEDLNALPPVLEGIQKPLSETEDTAGIARVIEILQCNTWSSMVFSHMMIQRTRSLKSSLSRYPKSSPSFNSILYIRRKNSRRMSSNSMIWPEYFMKCRTSNLTLQIWAMK